jgi:hypothetical protein
MTPDLQVDTDDLRHTAAALTGTATRTKATAAEAPATDPTPRWATTDAALLAADAARERLTGFGGDLAETARQIVAAADAYAEADARAAARLRSLR